MKFSSCLAIAVLTAGVFGAAGAEAGSIAVANFSFETLPAGGLTDTGFCVNPICKYSLGVPIPGWTITGSQTGQWIPGNPTYLSYFNYLPNGVTVAYSNGGSVSQTVGPTSVAGATYTLTVDVGYRMDGAFFPSTEELIVGAVPIVATGTAPTIGDWAPFTATYKAPTSGLPITIELISYGSQADWDDVTLTSSVPEPATWAMMLVGFAGLVGASLRRRPAVTA